MRIEDFSGSSAGAAVRTLDGYVAFVPNPLPPKLDLVRLIGPLAAAQHQLGQLAGIGRSLSNPYLLQRPFMRREAVSSSAIEGTITTLSQLLAYEATGEHVPNSDTKEVLNYVEALEFCFTSLDRLPISSRLLKEAHTILLSGLSSERGAAKRPGEFRTRDPAWTGSRVVHEARFVFVPPDQVDSTFSQLEKFISDRGDPGFPDLINAALIHYQFEVIHPFHDGNGRVGRLLIPLFLCSAGLLPQPLLFLSPYLERNREQYIAHLYEVSRTGAWENWIEFFLNGVSEQTSDIIIRSQKLLDLQNSYREKLQTARASALLTRLVDMIFERPVISIPQAASILGVSYNSAKGNVERLLEAGMLVNIKGGGTPRVFLAQEVYGIIYDPIENLGGPGTIRQV